MQHLIPDKGKPDPEIYLAVARQLNILPANCLVIEDSATGIQAALAAGMACLAVPSSFTRPGVLQSGLLLDTNITAPKLLQQTAEQFLLEYDQ
ncbi:MAG: HAD family phosphatase [Desulfovermiculus sp.]|nr:HAD family phosphatase [Desulfovermiculus sp.]